MSLSPCTIAIGDQNLTANVRSASWSSVDPGGFEVCQISLRSPVRAPRAGERITIRYGLEVAWQGRVNDPGNASADNAQVEAISGVGYGAALKERAMREIYRDVDLSRWTGPSVQRRIGLVAAGVDVDGVSVTTDETTGAPSLLTTFSGPTGRRKDSEGLYSGQGVAIGSIYYDWKKNANISEADANWNWTLYLMTDDVFTTSQNTGNLRAATSTPATLTASGAAKYFAAVEVFYNAAIATSGRNYDLFWTRLVVYGTHGLTKRGAEPSVGLYPTDIAAHALAKYNTELASTGHQGIELGPVDADSNLYAVPHAVYLDETPYEQIIDDMVRKQLGWHWGVWEPAGLHADTPRLFMTKPPEQATASVSRRELGDDFDAPRVRLDQLYNYAKVKYTDLAGRPNIVNVSQPNPLLDQAGVPYRILFLDAGVSTSAAATTYGTFALNLAVAAARGAGSATLPGDVYTGAGRKPACLLKAGRDRLRITDMPDPGPLHESDTRRYDTFHVRRVETSVGADGVPKTRVELGSGADLMEVLNARTAAATIGLT